MDPGHVPTSEMKICVTKDILAKRSILDIGRDPGYTSDCCHRICRKPGGAKRNTSKSTKFNVNNKEVLLILSTLQYFPCQTPPLTLHYLLSI